MEEQIHKLIRHGVVGVPCRATCSEISHTDKRIGRTGPHRTMEMNEDSVRVHPAPDPHFALE